MFKRTVFTVIYRDRDKGLLPQIVCIERVDKSDDGETMLYGCWFLRPNETFHLATRKFLQKVIKWSDVLIFYYCWYCSRWAVARLFCCRLLHVHTAGCCRWAAARSCYGRCGIARSYIFITRWTCTWQLALWSLYHAYLCKINVSIFNSLGIMQYLYVYVCLLFLESLKSDLYDRLSFYMFIYVIYSRRYSRVISMTECHLIKCLANVTSCLLKNTSKTSRRFVEGDCNVYKYINFFIVYTVTLCFGVVNYAKAETSLLNFHFLTSYCQVHI